MYGYGMQGPFMMPNMGYPSMLRAAPMFARPSATSALFGSAPRAGGILASLRGINWSGMLSNASKALGVVNQAIPVVKQVGPMMTNMKSMLKIASAFKDETDTATPVSNRKSDVETKATEEKESSDIKEEINTKTDTNKPNFFL